MDSVEREYVTQQAVEANGRGRELPNAFDVIRLAVAPAHLARWATLLMSFALFAGCLYRPSWIRLATACAFTLTLPMMLWWGAWRERKR